MITVEGYCPVCKRKSNIDVTVADDGKLVFTCQKHPQFSHRVTLPARRNSPSDSRQNPGILR